MGLDLGLLPEGRSKKMSVLKNTEGAAPERRSVRSTSISEWSRSL